jgi:hypothetical protein
MSSGCSGPSTRVSARVSDPRVVTCDNVVVEAEIRCVRSAGVAIAYQVVAAGELDIVYVPDFMSNLVYGWEHPYLRHLVRAPCALLPVDPVRQAEDRPL